MSSREVEERLERFLAADANERARVVLLDMQRLAKVVHGEVDLPASERGLALAAEALSQQADSGLIHDQIEQQLFHRGYTKRAELDDLWASFEISVGYWSGMR